MCLLCRPVLIRKSLKLQNILVDFKIIYIESFIARHTSQTNTYPTELTSAPERESLVLTDIGTKCYSAQTATCNIK